MNKLLNKPQLINKTQESYDLLVSLQMTLSSVQYLFRHCLAFSVTD
jgi:hypothetical protein